MYCVVRVVAFCAALAASGFGANASQVTETQPDMMPVQAEGNDSAINAQASMPATVIDRSPLFGDPLFGDVAPERFLFFAGVDLWSGGGSVHGGLLWAPWGLQRDGLVFKLVGGGGSYQYQSNGQPIRGMHAFDSLMAGYRFSGTGFEARLFLGLDVQNHWLSRADPANALRGFHTGVRVNGELWWEPLHATMVSSSFSVSSIGPNYNLRGAAGWKLFDSFYIGPEVETFSDLRYRQYRVGAHITALRTGAVEWTAGVGYAQDSSNASGMYGRLGFLIRR